MQDPKVSFVIPCYKLGHLLPECVNSILAQTYGDWEILIMDDHSPDNTPEVAATFKDPRVRYIRNDPNLGALPNYNKGIGLSRGKYVWLISADDYLRRPDVLKRYVEVLEANPRVGYAFCPGIGVKHGEETGLLDYSAYGTRDCVVNGHTFLQTLLDYNLVLAPAALARRECYEKLGNFPLEFAWCGERVNLIWGGDWYLWCLFALHYDVAYFAEPMVCYREHELAMTTIVTDAQIRNCFLADIAVPWTIKQRADAAGFTAVARKCREAMAFEYAHHLIGKPYRSAVSTITPEVFEDLLCRSTPAAAERAWMRARTFVEVGDRCFQRGAIPEAREFYRRAVAYGPWMWKAQVKRLLLSLGRPGEYVRRALQTSA